MMMPVAVSAKRWPWSEPRVHHRLPIDSEPNAVGAMPPDCWAAGWIAIVFAIGAWPGIIGGALCGGIIAFGAGIIGGALCGCTRPYICCCGGGPGGGG